MSIEKDRVITDIDESFNYILNDKFILEDLYERKIFLNSEIDENTIETAVYHIMRYNAIDKEFPVEERKPIRLYINSPGGLVIEGFALIDCIRLSKTPVYTINLGKSFSMALLIFMAGHQRYAMPHSQFLLHDGENGGADSAAKLKDYLDFSLNQISKMTKEYVLSYSNISEDSYDSNYRREWYFLVNEGKSLGIVDYIIGEDCPLSEIL